jgi:hypothetical protein
MHKKLIPLADSISSQLNGCITRLEKLQAFNAVHGEFIDTLECSVSLCGWSFDFDNPTREDVVKILQHFPGKWDKELHDATHINYTSQEQHQGFHVRCYNSPPPPSCKLVEVEELVPAIEARTVKRLKLQCVEDQPAA